MKPVTLRLLSQELISPQFTSAHDVVAHFGFMQAQDYRAMRWAVGMRTKKPSLKAFEKEFDEGRIIRTHLFRNTWQLIAAEDYWWMVDLCSAKARSGIRNWGKGAGITISENEEERFRTFLSATFPGRRSVSRDEIIDLAFDSGTSTDKEKTKLQISLAEVSGIICSGETDGGNRTYALSAERIPAQRTKTKEESLAELARRYFRSHAPASLEDFVWWTGLNIGDCKKGIGYLGDELVRKDWKGQTFYIHTGCRTKGNRPGAIRLLPAYDEYLIGYKSRHIALHPDHRHHAHDQKGIFWPVILQDGEVVGNWTANGGKITTSTFHENHELDQTKLQEEIRRYQTFQAERTQ